MKPEDIVVSLEWAKKLKKAGWPQDPIIFYWHRHSVGLSRRGKGGKFKSNANARIAAPTAQEILHQLPWKISEWDKLRIWMDVGGGWHLSYNNENMWDASLANAAAAMWCYLKEFLNIQVHPKDHPMQVKLANLEK